MNKLAFDIGRAFAEGLKRRNKIAKDRKPKAPKGKPLPLIERWALESERRYKEEE